MRFLLLGLLALAVVTGIQTVGVILTSALLITPAATAALLTDRMPRRMLLGAVLATACSVAGLIVSYAAKTSSGAAIVLCCTAAFVVAYAARSTWQRLRPAAQGRNRSRTNKSPGGGVCPDATDDQAVALAQLVFCMGCCCGQGFGSRQAGTAGRQLKQIWKDGEAQPLGAVDHLAGLSRVRATSLPTSPWSCCPKATSGWAAWKGRSVRVAGRLGAVLPRRGEVLPLPEELGPLRFERFQPEEVVRHDGKHASRPRRRARPGTGRDRRDSTAAAKNILVVQRPPVPGLARVAVASARVHVLPVRRDAGNAEARAAEPLAAFRMDSRRSRTDIAALSRSFLAQFGVDEASLRVEVVDKPSCPKFHCDNVPRIRLVATYHGPATEYVRVDDPEMIRVRAGVRPGVPQGPPAPRPR